MRGPVWGIVTAGIGVLMIGLLVAWGTAYGTWLDEIGPFIDDPGAAPEAPTIILPGLVGLLAVALVVGGVVIAVTTSPEREPRER